MRLKYKRTIYESPQKNYYVASYEPVDQIMGLAKNEVVCVGAVLPLSFGIIYDVTGHWKSGKYGPQFEVTTFKEMIVPSRDGIVGYLSSGQIRGIGEKTANDIYDAFGDETLEILDTDIGRLKEIHGIGDKKLEKITESYLENRGARDIIAFLVPYGVTPRKAIKFFERFGAKTMTTVKEHPYRLTEIRGIGFKIADKIAIKVGFDPIGKERIEAGILFALSEAEKEGHVCLPNSNLQTAAIAILATDGFDILIPGLVTETITEMVADGRLVHYDGKYYLKENAISEARLAKNVKAHMKSGKVEPINNLDLRIERVERMIGFHMAPEQIQAIKTALSNTLTVVTGGPGTGKTAIQKAMLEIYASVNPNGKVVCCAPTGKAARRMTESTGHEATTIHKALGLCASDDGIFHGTRTLEGDFIIVDEISMLDNFLADALFRAFQPGAQVVLVGDVDQLPSVGAGCVLKDLIDSGAVPVVRLARVFRQKAGSRIALNASLMKQGNAKLEYSGEDGDFYFVSSPDPYESADIIADLYVKEVDRIGLDNVCYLTPLRGKSATCVNEMNPVIRDRINPPSQDKPEVKFGNKVFRKGDKITQMRNFEDVANGDIGYILNILRDEDGQIIVQIDFGDDRIKFYDMQNLEMIDLAYSLTIHKSQGSEYATTIINLQSLHYIMLNRPLIYTAITRGKKRVIIVGEKKALCMAIKKEATNERFTGLKTRLQPDKLSMLLDEE